MKTILAAAMMLGLAGTAAAADGKGAYAVLGPGAHSCAEFTSAPAQVGEIMMIWVQGYATALNQALPEVKDVTGGRTDSQLDNELRRVCGNNPQMLLSDATRQMIVKMAGLEGKAKKTAKAEATDGAPALRR